MTDDERVDTVKRILQDRGIRAETRAEGIARDVVAALASPSTAVDEQAVALAGITTEDVWLLTNDPVRATVVWLRERAETAEARLAAHRASLDVCGDCSRLVVGRTAGTQGQTGASRGRSRR